eukprot:gene32385-2550_t
MDNPQIVSPNSGYQEAQQGTTNPKLPVTKIPRASEECNSSKTIRVDQDHALDQRSMQYQSSMSAQEDLVWASLAELDELTVIDVVDNEIYGISSACACCNIGNEHRDATYKNEFSKKIQAVIDGRADCVDIRKLLYAGHGLSLLLKARIGESSHTLLIDGGPSEELWKLNWHKLEEDVGSLDGAVLTHWHRDHSRGLSAVAQLVGPTKVGCAKAFIFDLHPERPHRRGIMLPSGNSFASFNASGLTDAVSCCLVATALRLSTRHRDHSRGLSAVAQLVGPTKVGCAKAFIFDLHPERPHRRGIMLPSGNSFASFNASGLTDAVSCCLVATALRLSTRHRDHSRGLSAVAQLVGPTK